MFVLGIMETWYDTITSPTNSIQHSQLHYLHNQAVTLTNDLFVALVLWKHGKLVPFLLVFLVSWKHGKLVPPVGFAPYQFLCHQVFDTSLSVTYQFVCHQVV